MNLSFLELRHLLDLWVTWYSLGVDGWLASEESTHICTLEIPTPARTSDPALDALFLRALNDFELHCSRLGGSSSFSRTGIGETLTSASAPLLTLLETEQPFLAEKSLSLQSELRREYGDLGSHTMTIALTIHEGQVELSQTAFEMNNRRRGLKLDLGDLLSNALAAADDLFAQGLALGYTVPDQPETLPFPCQSATEATHLARLSAQVAPTHHASADGSTLLSTHSLPDLVALLTFVRFCEPLGLLRRI
jgi:hypothetical protein